MKHSPSQYQGTLKNTICTRCHTPLNNTTREQQDEHEKKCLAQMKLFED